METLITNTIRHISHGNSLDGYIEVQQLKDGVWQTTGKFYQSDDWMMTNLEKHVQYLKSMG